ncbi:MAG: hypothetical protein ACI93N_002041 [Flavobacteriaceae bacterium]|jgi:hypothetical protein
MKTLQFTIFMILAIHFKMSSQNVFNNVYNDYSNINLIEGFDSFNNVPYHIEFYNNDYFLNSITKEDYNLFLGLTTNSFFISNDSIEVNGLCIKTDLFGDTLWQKEFKVYEKGFVEFYNALELENGNCFLIGIYGDSIFNALEIGKVLLKIDSNGNELWHKTFDDFEREYFIDALKINENSYYLLSSNYLDNDTVLPCITNIDSNGNEIWKKCYKDNVQNFPRGFVKIDSNIFISSLASGPVDLNENRVSLYKLDTLANKINYLEYSDAKTFSINNINEENLAYYRDDNGLHIIISGNTQESLIDKVNWMILSIDENGNIEWIKKDLDTVNYSVFSSIAILETKKIVCIGGTKNHDQQSNPLSGDAVMFVLMDLQGNVIVQKEINTNVEDHQYYIAYNVKETKDGGFLITGYSMDHQAIDEDSVFLKNNGWVLKTDSCGYSVGDIPEPFFVIDSIVQNKENNTVYITEKSTNYCSAVLNWGDASEETNYYAYENNLPLAEKQIQHSFSENGAYTIKATTLAGEEFREYEVVITIVGVGIDDLEGENGFISMFPNPSSDYIVVENPNTGKIPNQVGHDVGFKNKGFVMSVYNLNGKLMESFNLNSKFFQQKIDISTLMNGVYFIKFTFGHEMIGAEKLVIARLR